MKPVAVQRGFPLSGNVQVLQIAPGKPAILHLPAPSPSSLQIPPTHINSVQPHLVKPPTTTATIPKTYSVATSAVTLEMLYALLQSQQQQIAVLRDTQMKILEELHTLRAGKGETKQYKSDDDNDDKHDGDNNSSNDSNEDSK